MTQSGQAKVYRKQGATEQVIDAGGYLNIASGKVRFPGNLARGYDSLVPVAAKTTATASGVITNFTTGTQPSIRTAEIASGSLIYGWSTAAGNDNPLYCAPWRVPNDLSTADPIRIHYKMRTSGAATNGVAFIARANAATADIGATAVLSSSPAEAYIEIASGSVPATGCINLTIKPNTHATGNVALYSIGVSYGRKTS